MSINYVTACNVCTLAELVSYNGKDKDGNGVGVADGESHNRSWNCGAEDPTTNPRVKKLRRRQQRNFLLTLLLSQGVPMIAHGDELGRTQSGNNNGYCQDNGVTWVDWDLDDERAALLDFARRVVRLRRDHPVLRRRRFFAGAPQHGGESDIGEIAWFTPAGTHMTDADWDTSFARSLMVFLNGEAIPEPDARGERIVDDSVLALLNADADPVDFQLPGAEFGARWTVALDSGNDRAAGRTRMAGSAVRVDGRSFVVLVRPPLSGA